jgi:hypothetical protein
MRSTGLLRTKTLHGLVLLTLACIVLVHPAFAANEPKTYPEVGQVTGTGTGKRSVGQGGTAFTRTYKVETDTKVFELDCGKMPFFARTGGECGGEKKLQIGDTIHFRTQKEWAYISITQKDQSGRVTPSEQKLRILSEDLKPAAKPADAKQ